MQPAMTHLEHVKLSWPPKRRLKIPLALAYIEAGFPSPVEGELDRPLDLNELLIEHPRATFFVRVQGDSMRGAGLFSGDLLIVDRALKARSGDVIIAALNGSFTVKRLNLGPQGPRLIAENPQYRDIMIQDTDDFVVWGVVRFVIHKP